MAGDYYGSEDEDDEDDEDSPQIELIPADDDAQAGQKRKTASPKQSPKLAPANADATTGNANGNPNKKAKGGKN